MKHIDFSRLENGKENKVRHFGGSGNATFSPSLGKSKHHLNLKGRVLDKMKDTPNMPKSKKVKYKSAGDHRFIIPK